MKVEWLLSKTINGKMLWEFIVLEHNDPGAVSKKICLAFDHNSNGHYLSVNDYMTEDLINVYFTEKENKKK